MEQQGAVLEEGQAVAEEEEQAGQLVQDRGEVEHLITIFHEAECSNVLFFLKLNSLLVPSSVISHILCGASLFRCFLVRKRLSREMKKEALRGKGDSVMWYHVLGKGERDFCEEVQRTWGD